MFVSAKPYRTEERFEFGGWEVYTEIHITPIEEDEEVQRVLTVVRDITPRKQAEEELRRIEDGAKLAAKLRLEVGVGHGLDYRNVQPVAALETIREFSIGHSIVARAVLIGMERAVREMRALVRAD